MIIMCVILFTVYPFKLIGHLIEHSLKELRSWLFMGVLFTCHPVQVRLFTDARDSENTKEHNAYFTTVPVCMQIAL